MKNTRIICLILAMGFAAAVPGIPLLADDAGTVDATTATLISGQWRFTGKSWTNDRIFYRNGTLVNLDDNSTGPIHWTIHGNKLLMQFADYDDILFLPLDPKGTKGIDRDGNEFIATKIIPKPPEDPQTSGTSISSFGRKTPGLADTPAPAPVTVSADEQQKAADLVKTCHNSLIMVNGSNGRGSAFVATMGGAKYIITNAHVMAMCRNPAFNDLDNKAIPAGRGAAAVGADLFRLETTGGTPLEIMQDVDKNASIGDGVVVLGNAEGQGVVNTIMGKIVGIGPQLVEIDAQIVPGNSGSPIIHLKSGKVIGIATYLNYKKYDIVTMQKLKETVIRRFGYRLDYEKEWQPVNNWAAFYAQSDAVEKLQAFSADLGNLYADIRINGHIPPGRHTNPLIRDRVDDWIRDKSSLSNAEDAMQCDQMFISFIKTVAQMDVNTVRPSLTYDFFQRRLDETSRERAGEALYLEKFILHKP